MRRSCLLLSAFVCLTIAFATAPIAQANESPAESTGPGIGFLQSGDSFRGDGSLLLHSDESYENGYAWRSGGVVPPDYGSFAESYLGAGQVHSAVFDLSQTGSQFGQTADVYVWDDESGSPGAVLCVTVDIDPGPISQWPSISRHVVDLPECDSSEEWWVGFWGNWPGALNGWFIAADENGPGGGDTFTNIAPGIGYTTGWQDVSVVWGPTQALGIGAIVSLDPPVTTLQDLIDAAAPGEVVLVPAGTYTGIGNRSLDFGGKDITLRGEQGSNATIIDCEDNGRAFHFHTGETAAATVEGFTIRNGEAPGPGGAVLVEGTASPTLRNLVIENCVGTTGGAIAVIGGGIQVFDSRLQANSGDTIGGGVVHGQNATVLLENVSHRGSFEGGVWAEQSSVTINGGDIRGNRSGLNGAAIRATDGADVLLDFGIVAGNFAEDGGAIYVDETSTLTISRSNVSSNRARGDGGAIWAAGTVTVERSILWSNCAAGSGDQIRSEATAQVEVSCGTLDLSGVSGSITYGDDVLSTDPMLCAPADCQSAPTTLGNLHLQEGSPGLPLYSPCGALLGPLWIRCPVPHVPAGACCLSTSECFLTVAELCGPYGGFYAGDGSVCEPGNCEPASAPDPAEGASATLRLQLSGPHPMAGAVHFAVETAEGGRMHANVYDTGGRHVAEVFDGEVGPGRHELTWNGRIAGETNAATGVYYLRVGLGTEEVSRTVVMAR